MDGLAVRVVNGDHSAKVTLVLRRTMGKNVTLGGVSTFDGAAGTHLKALGGPISTVSRRAKPHRGGFLKNDSACKKADFITFYVWAQVP